MEKRENGRGGGDVFITWINDTIEKLFRGNFSDRLSRPSVTDPHGPPLHLPLTDAHFRSCHVVRPERLSIIQPPPPLCAPLYRHQSLCLLPRYDSVCASVLQRPRGLNGANVERVKDQRVVFMMRMRGVRIKPHNEDWLFIWQRVVWG